MTIRAIVTGLAGAAFGVLGCRAFTDTSPSPLLRITPPSLSFVGRVGGDDPPAQYLTLMRTGGGSAHWTLSADNAWVSVSSAGDTLPFLVSVRPRTTGLPAGTVAGAITVAMGGQIRAVPVTLELRTTRSLTGRWVGVRDTLDVALTLADSAGVVRGSGSLSGPPRSVVVSGSHTDPDFALTLVGPGGGADTTRLIGSLANDNTMSAWLSGRDVTNLPITLFRQ